MTSTRYKKESLTTLYRRETHKLLCQKIDPIVVAERIEKTEFHQFELTKELIATGDYLDTHDTVVDVHLVKDEDRPCLTRYFEILSNFSGKLYFINILFHTKYSCSSWSPNMQKEREYLATYFIKKSLELNHFMAKIKVIIDFVNPFTLRSSLANESKQRQLRETDLIMFKKDMDVQNESCCPYVIHRFWNSNIYICSLICYLPVENDFILETIKKFY
ncbi:hypothetical protein RF11_01637 [Thelohanellus kitauei]|uniref:Uncharacterized protein n=1 Tax=Thelohanellus kitauei TaxID=669202 RepID=A0A0C2JLA6_THEKT|nr:hypothetical protein RF11_01637 [Thelohanellus kitauei]